MFSYWTTVRYELDAPLSRRAGEGLGERVITRSSRGFALIELIVVIIIVVVMMGLFLNRTLY